jgi:hypothetical protein
MANQHTTDMLKRGTIANGRRILSATILDETHRAQYRVECCTCGHITRCRRTDFERHGCARCKSTARTQRPAEDEFVADVFIGGGLVATLKPTVDAKTGTIRLANVPHTIGLAIELRRVKR